MVQILQLGAIAVLALVTVVVVGVDQGKQRSSDRPAESKGQLERLREEHLEDSVPLRK
ncbi:hypothetical protein SynMITS9220_01141 [Synechococcus sp. MIT S9220]|nr:hypothetical protein [Synechococcus sp. MIT S9220]QNJ22445.1 hypothetical protein SynMITS9220_01141 [Synechococcus sp. MIT S9220]